MSDESISESKPASESRDTSSQPTAPSLAEERSDDKRAQTYRAAAEELKMAVENAWDGACLTWSSGG